MSLSPYSELPASVSSVLEFRVCATPLASTLFLMFIFEDYLFWGRWGIETGSRYLCCPELTHVDHVGLDLTDMPAHVSLVLRLKTYTTTPKLKDCLYS